MKDEKDSKQEGELGDMGAVRTRRDEVMTFRRETEGEAPRHGYHVTGNVGIDDWELDNFIQDMESASESDIGDESTLTKRFVVETPKPLLRRDGLPTLKTPRPDFITTGAASSANDDEPIIVLENPRSYVIGEHPVEGVHGLPEKTETNPSLSEADPPTLPCISREALMEFDSSEPEDEDIPKTLEMSLEQSEELHKMFEEFGVEPSVLGKKKNVKKAQAKGVA